jgi:hypothetical protein
MPRRAQHFPRGPFLDDTPGGSNPINASASIVFPLPDSPTNPSDSPAAMCSDTSFTGRTHPVAAGSSTVSPRTSSKFVIGLSSYQRAKLEIQSTRRM